MAGKQIFPSKCLSGELNAVTQAKYLKYCVVPGYFLNYFLKVVNKINVLSSLMFHITVSLLLGFPWTIKMIESLSALNLYSIFQS